MDVDVVWDRGVGLVGVRVVGEGYRASFCEECALGEGFGLFCVVEECASGSDDRVAGEGKLGGWVEDVDEPGGVGGRVWVWGVDEDGFRVVEFFCDLLFLGLGEGHGRWEVNNG